MGTPDVVLVRWYCGMTVGTYFMDGEYHDVECANSGVIAVPAADWAEGMARYTCPVCHSLLQQGDDHFEPVEEAIS